MSETLHAPSASLERADIAALLELLRVDTVSPVEERRFSDLPTAQRLVADFFAARVPWLRSVGLIVPPPAVLDDPLTPAPVRAAAEELGVEAFLGNQPSQVFTAGREERDRRLVLNIHLDTVGGVVPVALDDGRISGRGAVDVKGALVAVACGLADAVRREPTLLDDVGLAVHVVAGEEGGAMGVLGTRVLVDQGWTGALNVFCEPTEHRYLTRFTATMTPRIVVEGEGSTDDRPGDGHNATAVLAHVAQRIVEEMEPLVEEEGGILCLAGLRSGDAHNRVYGSGSLACNIAYPSSEAAERLARAFADCIARATGSFEQRHRESSLLGLTARDVERITSVVWEKRGIPARLGGPDPLEEVLQVAGFAPWPQDARPFTCDAVWVPEASGLAVACGPGSLAANHAHADGEFVEVADLDRFAQEVASLVGAFRSHVVQEERT